MWTVLVAGLSVGTAVGLAVGKALARACEYDRQVDDCFREHLRHREDDRA